MNSKVKVMLHRGMDRVRQKRYDEAVALFDQLLAENDQLSDAWNNRGVALFALGRLEEALESYDRCLSLDPENLDAMRNKAFSLRSSRRLQEALALYDRVLEKGGDGYDLEAAAAVLTGLGRLEEALNCLMLAKNTLPLERIEDEIGMVKGLMEKNGGESS